MGSPFGLALYGKGLYSRRPDWFRNTVCEPVTWGDAACRPAPWMPAIAVPPVWAPAFVNRQTRKSPPIAGGRNG